MMQTSRGNVLAEKQALNETPELKDYTKVVGKYKWLIILGTLLCVVTTVIATAYMAPVYEASIQLLVSQKQATSNGQTAGEAYQAILTSERLARTFSHMLKNRSTAEKVVEKLKIPIPPEELVKNIEAGPVRDTQLIEVKVQDKDPVRAKRIANTLGVIFKDIVESLEKDKSSRGEIISISVVEPAVEPLNPIKPKPLLNMILAFLIGLMSSTGLAFILSYMDTTIKEADEIERTNGLISLGQIPFIPKKSDELIIKTEPRSVVAEAFRMLRTNIQYINFESKIKTFVITSSGVGEGKTLFSANFAAVMARAGFRVLVVGCDLRRPRLHQVFRASNDIGLANILIGTSSLAKAVQETDIKDLDIVASGPTPPNPVDLLESKRMEKFLDDVKQRYDFVILDCPPISTITDALVLVGNTDGVIMVARRGETRRQAFSDAKQVLDRVNARILGFVLNGATMDGVFDYYLKSYDGETHSFGPKRGLLKKILVAAILFGGLVIAIGTAINFGVAETVLNIF